MTISQINLSIQNISLRTDSCLVGGRYKVECLQKLLCGQLDHWLISTGVWVCAIYILSGWLLWLWWNHIYVNIDWEAFYLRHPSTLVHGRLRIGPAIFAIPCLGDLRNIKMKIYWDSFIRDKASKLLLGYAVAVLYFALS